MSALRFEQDLMDSDEFKQKLRVDENFAQAFYCALENQAWGKDGDVYTCSFRYAGGLVANLRCMGEGYMDFYCCGRGIFDDEEPIQEGPTAIRSCTIRPDVAEELAKLGWYPVQYPRGNDVSI